jgi:hypothetical protein
MYLKNCYNVGGYVDNGLVLEEFVVTLNIWATHGLQVIISWNRGDRPIAGRVHVLRQ